MFFYGLTIWNQFITTIRFTSRLYYSNSRIIQLLWEEAFECDFFQKQIFVNSLYSFLIPSGIFFSEKLFTENLIRFVLDLIIWNLQYYTLFNLDNFHSPLFLIFSFFFIIYSSCFLSLFLL